MSELFFMELFNTSKKLYKQMKIEVEKAFQEGTIH